MTAEDNGRREAALHKLRMALEQVLGEIELLEQKLPGVYYAIIARPGGEHYIVEAGTQAISAAAKKYGQAIPDFPGFLLYPQNQEKSGYSIIAYEIEWNQMRNTPGAIEAGELYDTATYGRLDYPEYFGSFPVPSKTPWGYTLRYHQLDNGIYWLETDAGLRGLAVCYPICDAELAPSTIARAVNGEPEQTPEPEYLFFDEQTSCIPLFELLDLRPAWDESGLINAKALMNKIWVDYTAYALIHNLQEQTGQNMLLDMICEIMGVEKPVSECSPTRLPDGMICLFPDVGTDYLNL